MKIQGTLPPWLRGTLYRTVPATFESSYSVAINDDEKETHWIHFEHLFVYQPWFHSVLHPIECLKDNLNS